MAIPSDEEQLQALKDIGLMPADDQRAKVWYENNASAKLTEIRLGEFARETIAKLPAWGSEYSDRFKLLTQPIAELPFEPKSFRSVVNKLYRALESGDRKQADFSQCFVQLPDLIRLTLTCPYGDGPIFLAKRLNQLATDLKLSANVRERANEFGYYAIHFTFKMPVQILSLDKNEITTVDLTAELQLTTQLQASLRSLTHEIYETRRLEAPTGEWRWDFEHELFKPSYTGHTLHLLESLILSMKKDSEARK